MKEQRHYVEYEEAQLAFDRWDVLAPYWKLPDYIGTEDVSRHYAAHNDAFWFDEDQVSRVRALLSPHWKTIVKAWLLKHGEVVKRLI